MATSDPPLRRINEIIVGDLIVEFEVIAHRGFSAIAPENTLAAFSSALREGADSIELDLQLSADGIPVVIHDETLERIAGKPDKVRETPIAVLQGLDVGAWFGDRFAGERIPTFSQVLAAIASLPKHLYLDVKPHCEWGDRQIDDLLALLLREGWETRCIISSFNESFVNRVRQRNYNFTLGYIVADADSYQQELAKAASARNTVMISLYKILLANPQLVEASDRAGVEIVAWTVDDPDIVRQLGELGVKRIVTNRLVGQINSNLTQN
jgi:glycerophosphoryl diester phosphodiesterase